MPRGEGLKKVIITPDAILAQVIGSDPIQALQLASKVWKYINDHNLKSKAVN